MSATGSTHSSQRGLILLLAAVLQCVFIAVTYVYFTHELKQVTWRWQCIAASGRIRRSFKHNIYLRLREAYIKSNIACLNEDNFGAVRNSDPKNLDPLDPCWEVKYQLQSLIKKIIAKQYQSQAPEQVRLSEVQTPGNGEAVIQEMPTRVAAAHVTGSNVKHSNPLGRSLIRYDGQKIVDWKSYKQPSFLNNIEINHGELVIKKSGFYYIYSQTYFRQRSEVKTEEGKGTQLVQRVYKITAYPDPILVMKNIKTSCWSKDAEYALNSIYQGGIYKFNEDDRIFVTVSDISILDMDEKGTYFGAFLLF